MSSSTTQRDSCHQHQKVEPKEEVEMAELRSIMRQLWGRAAKRTTKVRY